MSDHNSDIDIDIVESPSDTCDGSIKIEIKQEDIEESIELNQVIEEPVRKSKSLTKETRKLRKKKNLDSEDEDNTTKKAKKTPAASASPSGRTRSPAIKKETSGASTVEEIRNAKKNESVKATRRNSLTRKIRSIDVFNGDADIDDMDTDDLLDEVDQLPAIRQAYINNRKSTRRRVSPIAEQKAKKMKNKLEVYNPQKVKQLSEQYPDTYWRFHADSGYGMINSINANHSLQTLPINVSDEGPITGMTLSDDGKLLATFCNMGSIKVWDVDNNCNLMRKIHDKSETEIEEFYCGQFLTEKGFLVAGGKLKARHKWSHQDNDNFILDCDIKIFDVDTGDRVALLKGHSEEILCIKALSFKGNNYFISTSQDGYIIKWHMDETWTKLLDKTEMLDGSTCMAFTVSFVPNTGNKFFIAACDEHLKLYDFEQATLIQTFEDIYSSYCDCGKFVPWLDEHVEIKETGQVAEMEKQVNDLSVSDNDGKEVSAMEIESKPEEEPAPYAYFISRGAEMCDVSEGVSSKPNTCTLHKLVYPTKIGGKFELQTVKKFMHEDYHANSWLVKITSNGRYILAPTIDGQIYVFNMATGQASAMIKEHEDLEVRDVIFHPYEPLIFSAGDDGHVKVHTYDFLIENNQAV